MADGRTGNTVDEAGDRGSSREVALLGGSFNPPHVAHVMAVYWVLATQPVSEVWLLPTYKHAFGKELAPFEHRVRMCELAAAHVRGAHVCSAEADLEGDPLVGKTVRTLEHLRSKHPSLRFALIVGADVLAESHNWYRWDRITELARVIVVGRQGFPATSSPQLPDISSTEIRERIRDGRSVDDWVPRRVLEYAQKHQLYAK